MTRDRPAETPVWRQCERCKTVYVGAEWHVFCAVCIEDVAKELRAAQRGASGDAVK